MEQGVVRFITAGSVDDGKSTLIGRLLYDTKAILADQLQALSRTRHARVKAEDAEVDLALLTDGLEAEREQGITIDVAYRYFTTPRRKFIVSDAPGHEQYTRNLVTGASQSDVAVILVDATRVDRDVVPAGLLAQTKRHAAIVRLLGLRHVVFAVNKMDLLGFEEAVFGQIRASLEDMAARIGLPQAQYIPVSALRGDNVVEISARTPWHTGPSLLQWLEGLHIGTAPALSALRLPVQFVARQDGSAADDFRGYLGRIESGSLRVGQSVTVLPSGFRSTVSELHVSNGKPAEGGVQVVTAGQPVVVSLADDIDISRGDLIVASEENDANPAVVARTLSADICWLDAEPLSLSRKYLLQHTTSTVFAKVKGVRQVLDVQTLSHGERASGLVTNDIGRIDLVLQKPIVADHFDDSAATGAFVLIDEATKHTVAAGMIRQAA